MVIYNSFKYNFGSTNKNDNSTRAMLNNTRIKIMNLLRSPENVIIANVKKSYINHQVVNT